MTDTPRDCPCGSAHAFEACCGKYISGAEHAPTPEALMRSRYAAFVVGGIDYIENTLAPHTRHDFDRAHVEQWSQDSEWLGLEIKSTDGGGPGDAEGWVEFVARFRLDGKDYAHHETSRFQKDAEDGRWYYVDGVNGPRTVRKGPKVGRNDPCPCGSGKKYKKCCGAAA